MQPHVLERLSQSTPELVKKRPEHDWSIEELQKVLFDALYTDDSAFCFFLDGLDEIEVPSDDRALVISLVSRLSHHPNIKICVSSRPENIFTQAVSSSSYLSLKTEDPNRPAIKVYVKKQLRPYKYSLPTDHNAYEKVVGELIRKASGVFLWVALATQSILRGITNGDTWHTLCGRTEKLEPDLNQLFRQMLERQNSGRRYYKKETARLLWRSLYGENSVRPSSLLSYILGTHEALTLRVMESVKQLPDIAEAVHIYQEYEKRLSSRSAGLLEINKRSNDISHLLQERVGFIHRSVSEFLLETTDGHEILLLNQTTSRERLLWTADGLKYYCYAFAATLTNNKPGLKMDIGNPEPIAEYGKFISSLRVAQYISTSEELELLLSFKNLCQSHYATEYPDTVFFTTTAKNGAVAFLSQEHGKPFEKLSSRIKSEILLWAIKGCESYLHHSETVKLDYKIAHGRKINEADWKERLKKRGLYAITWLLRAGADPNMIISKDISGFPWVRETPFTRFLVRHNCGGFRITPYKYNRSDIHCLDKFKQHGADCNQFLFFSLTGMKKKPRRGAQKCP